MPIASGPTWERLARVKLPEHQIMRIKTYLGGTGIDDLVYVEWHGTIKGGFDEGEVVDRLVIVGEDGAGRRLRRKIFEAASGEILDDVASIYLCTSADPADPSVRLRYAFVDCGDNSMDKPLLVCRREDFHLVFSALKMGGSGTGHVWRGERMLDETQWTEFDESPFLFPAELIRQIEDNTVNCLIGGSATMLFDWGVAPKRGILLHGRPGNGKTVLSKIAAKRALQAGINVVFLAGQSWNWEGISEPLQVAASRAPVLIIVDDIDLHCGRRVTGDDAGQDSKNRQQFLADLLNFLDGIEHTKGYVFLATTNFPGDLDDALLRTGRLDVHIPVTGPSPKNRKKLLRAALTLGTSVPIPELTKGVDLLDGCSYADVAELARRYKIAIVGRYGEIAVDQEVFDATAEAFAAELAAARDGSADE